MELLPPFLVKVSESLAIERKIPPDVFNNQSPRNALHAGAYGFHVFSVIVLEGRGGCDDYVCGEETQERIH